MVCAVLSLHQFCTLDFPTAADILGGWINIETGARMVGKLGGNHDGSDEAEAEATSARSFAGHLPLPVSIVPTLARP
jgi:hypothetical protein